jgi:hypothetical protein
MDPAEVVMKFFDALNSSGPSAAGEHLDEASSLASDTPVTSRAMWVGRQQALLSSFSDLHEDFDIICVNGNVVHGINHVTGTPDGDLDLSQMGIGVLSATGIKVTAIMSVAHTVEQGKIVSSTAKPVANMGFAHVLAQIGVNIP